MNPGSSFSGPYARSNRENYTLKERIIYTGLGLVFLGMLVLYVFEFPHFDRTGNVSYLALFAGIAGVFTGSLIARNYRHVAKGPTETMQLYVFCIGISLMFMPLLVSLSNRLLTYHPFEEEKAFVLEVDKRITERFGILKGEKMPTEKINMTVEINNQIMRYTTVDIDSNLPKRGDTILVKTRMGLWGFRNYGF